MIIFLPLNRDNQTLIFQVVMLTLLTGRSNTIKLKTTKLSLKGLANLFSGPGIYLNQLISNFLGLQIHQDKLTISPAIPKDLNGLEVRFKLEAKDILVSYIHSDEIFKLEWCRV